jgi:hypothetical protein
MPGAGERPGVEPVDAFDLPSWLGEERVIWVAEDSLGQHHRVRGTLRGPEVDEVTEGCDVLAGDHAYPFVALDDAHRREVHQAWRLGQVLLLRCDGRLTLAVPGSVVDEPLALEAVRRFAKAVGAPVDRFSVTLRL